MSGAGAMPPWRPLADGLRFPEGPAALADGSLLVVEIARGTLTRIGPDGRCDVVATPGGGPNGAALGPDGRVYVCNNGGLAWAEADGILRPDGCPDDYSGGRIERIDLATGAVEVLYEACDGRRLNGPNDLVFDAHGGFWFTDIGKVRARDRDRGAVYYAQADGSAIRRAIFPLLSPNGIGLSPDGTSVIVADTETGRLVCWDVVEPGVARLLPWPAPWGGRVLAGRAGLQRFDSLAVEASGAIAVGNLAPGGIDVFAAVGSHMAFLATGDPLTTNICFGGPDRRTAYVTLGGTGRVVTLDWPRPGLPLAHEAAA